MQSRGVVIWQKSWGGWRSWELCIGKSPQMQLLLQGSSGLFSICCGCICTFNCCH